ncbi:MAG TPA: hypothetical protein VF893_04285 [Candidatus Bathyarchaeia archaeon]
MSTKQKRCFVCTLTVALLFSIATMSLVQARTEDVSPPPAVDESGQPTADIPVLIMTQDGNATAPEEQAEQPNLYQAQDPPTAVDDNSTGVMPQDDTESSQENSLIATQSTPDSTVPIVGIAGVIAVVAAVSAFLFVRKRNTTN